MDTSTTTDDNRHTTTPAKAERRAPLSSAAEHAEKCMTQEEFKNEIARRGWSLRALADRWEITENWLHKLIRKKDRPLHWDDALRGLPIKMPSK